MKKSYSLHNDLIEEMNKTIENKILTLSEEEIESTFDNINESTDDSDEYSELYILEKLEDKFKNKTIYYRTRQYKKRDWQAFMYAVPTFAITMIFTYLLYVVITCHNNPKRNELQALIRELKTHNVIVTARSDGYHKPSQDYLEVTTSSVFCCDSVYDLLDEAFEVHASIYGWIKRRIIWLSVCLFICIIFLLSCISDWLCPHYKEYYEKWGIIEQKLDEKISFLKQKN